MQYCHTNNNYVAYNFVTSYLVDVLLYIFNIPLGMQWGKHKLYIAICEW